MPMLIDYDYDWPALPYPPEVVEVPEQSGFFLRVDGVDAHVLGSPDMDAETLSALEAMIRAATKMHKHDVGEE